MLTCWIRNDESTIGGNNDVDMVSAYSHAIAYFSWNFLNTLSTRAVGGH